MSKKVLISKERIAAMIEVAVANARAEQRAEAPDYIVQNSNVYITNMYGGDDYEPDNVPAPQPQQEATRSAFHIRKSISNLFIRAEQKAQELEAKNKGGLTEDARSATAALIERFEELQLRLKGDTSLELIRDAYVMMALQLCLASDLSGVFEDV